MLKLRFLLLLPALALTCLSAKADSLYTFESTPAGTYLPLTLTDSDITAIFTGNGVTLNSSGYTYSLSGIILAEYANNGDPLLPLNVAFSADLSSLSFNFATAQMDSLIVNLFEDGNSAGSFSFTTAVPPGYSYPEGFASVAGTFNSISITTASGSNFAVDNLRAVASAPEPSSVFLLGTGLASLAASRLRKVRINL